MEINLSKEQQYIYDKYLQGDNIFITGPGGTGKTKLIQYIVDEANEDGKRLQLCSMTGCSALLFNRKAKTVHSWAGIGLAKGDNDKIISRVCKSKYKKKNWKSVDILIVDEVSMMSLKIFNILDKIGRNVRKKNIPFGGMQIIFAGDFYQLPPVGDMDDRETSQFCFESKIWNDVFQHQVELTKIFRQKDQAYVKILNEIRVGKIKKSTIQALKKYIGRKIDPESIIEPTRLYPLRRTVESLNQTQMDKIGDKEYNYKYKRIDDITLLKKSNDIEINKSFDEKRKMIEQDFMLKNLNCNEDLTLKMGSQVMCIINLDMDSSTPICNGSQGVIIKMDNGIPLVKFNNGSIRKMCYHVWESENIPGVGIAQIPLILSWAITIHKSQGVTLDMAEIDIGSGIFECGQSYVALSRVKNLDGLYLKSFDPSKITINKKVHKFYNEKMIKSVISDDNINTFKKEDIDTNTVKKKIKKKIIKTKSVKIPLDLNNPLVKSLKDYRYDKSKEKNVPAFCIFSDNVINNIVDSKPKTLVELGEIDGIGATKIDQYGNDIISHINNNEMVENISEKPNNNNTKINNVTKLLINQL